ncbi:MAG: isoaspartyl peptidase/L-asparaginase [Actinomycetota bacterium]
MESDGREPNLVYVHGGVSGTERDELPALAHALPDALRAPTALDAVEAAVRELEDDPALNAGYGSVLNRSGEVEMDAGLADGAAARWAGVANVTVRHPISLARRVLERSPHVLVAGRGAMDLAEGMELLEDTTPEQRRRWERARAQNALGGDSYLEGERFDTVGAVALDPAGSSPPRPAAGASTGGVFAKLRGRVGDSPIFGAGFYASGRAAVVGTGVGELFLSELACLQAGRLIEEGAAPQSACEVVIEGLGRREKVSAGLLALDASGRAGAAYRGGSWPVEGPGGPFEARRLG